MPAAVTARDRLRDVRNETAAQLLSEVLADVDPLGPTYITSLDSLLGPTADDSAARADGDVTGDAARILHRSHVTEIQGRSKCGKTALLTFLAATFLLPERFTADFTRRTLASAASGNPSVETISLDVHLGGRGPGRAVLLFDTDGRFSTRALQRMLFAHCKARIAEAVRRSTAFDRTGTLAWQEPSLEHLQSQAREWMKALKVWRPTSSATLALSVKSARHMLRAADDPRETALILVDSISAFSFSDQSAAAQAEKDAGAPLPPRARYKDFAAALRELKLLQSQSGAPLIMTSHGVVEEDPQMPNAGAVRQGQLRTAPPDKTGRISRHFPESPLPNGRWWSSSLPTPPYPAFVVDDTAPAVPLRAWTSAAGGLVLHHHITLQATSAPQYPASTRECAARADLGRQRALDQLHVRGWLRSRREGAMGIFRFRVLRDSLAVSV